MAFDNAIHHCQAQPHIVLRDRPRMVNPIESVNHMRQMLGRNPTTSIYDAHLQPRCVSAGRDLHCATLRRMGYRIRDEIADR